MWSEEILLINDENVTLPQETSGFGRLGIQVQVQNSVCKRQIVDVSGYRYRCNSMCKRLILDVSGYRYITGVIQCVYNKYGTFRDKSTGVIQLIKVKAGTFRGTGTLVQVWFN